MRGRVSGVLRDFRECVCQWGAYRYHVGRHVTNLQVVNTYEGKSSVRLCIRWLFK